MAELFLGFTSGPGGFRKYVVIKRILPDARDNEQFERMFLDEARITAAFNHPNIAQVFDLGQEDDGLYLAMEFIAGQNLNQLTGACLRRKQQLSVGFVLSVARDVCLALHYAHTFTTPSGEPSPVIHRDVAQKNIMVTYDGVVKLLDFGIAKAKGSLERTHAGTVKGTTGYMSPEQVRGDKLDGRSDLFSVGVMMHELLTGARLFAGKTERDEMVKILEAPIPWPSHVAPHVSEQVSKVVMQALERSREKRFANGRDMARAIEAAASGILQDSEHRASLMRELFSERMAATRALLESADGTASSLMVESAKRALRSDDGPYLPARDDMATPKDVAAVPRKASRKVPTARGADKAPPPTADDPNELTPSQRRWSNVLWGTVMLAIVVGGGYGAVRLSKALDATIEPVPERLPHYESGLAVFREPGSDAGTEPEEAVPGKSTRPADPAPRPAAPPEEEEKTARTDTPSRAQGKLIFAVVPMADVFLDLAGSKKSPTKLASKAVYQLSLPVGTHRLLVVGDDKKRRVVNVPVEAGKTSTLRLRLEEIPEG
ncbi:protein kinase [Myxococcus sp. K15C18031901]|uniref:serine/threonine protein kinase n=1 Tax=Myxococcus dinghuensis TaxID=2906761 RepID=UPI0020A77AFA|nr:protein kinase [Myxococcus dinghuensis]